MPAVHDDAICIRLWDWSETSQTVSLFCRSHGVVRGLAKGAKREDARFSGGFELFTRGQAGMILKNADAMATLTGWDLSETFPAARRSLPAFYSSMAMLDLVHHMVRDHDPHPALFDGFLRASRRLGEREESIGALLDFLWTLLSEAGFRPELESDVRSGEALNTGGVLVFDPRSGGFTHSRLGAADEQWRVRVQTLHVLRQLAGAGTPSCGVEDALRAAKLLGAYVRETAGAPVGSLGDAFRALTV
ncbi:MAG: DNA repair protein RecO [Planctomycetes bacterium]|nr:DNA repair protein RecO [Planctomycetota bacterium]